MNVTPAVCARVTQWLLTESSGRESSFSSCPLSGRLTSNIFRCSSLAATIAVAAVAVLRHHPLTAVLRHQSLARPGRHHVGMETSVDVRLLIWRLVFMVASVARPCYAGITVRPLASNLDQISCLFLLHRSLSAVTPKQLPGYCLFSLFVMCIFTDQQALYSCCSIQLPNILCCFGIVVHN